MISKIDDISIEFNRDFYGKRVYHIKVIKDGLAYWLSKDKDGVLSRFKELRADIKDYDLAVRWVKYLNGFS
jgi:hypothetical protein